MNEGAIARWLEQKRRSDWAWASVICVLTLGCGVAVFLLTNVVIYTLVDIVSGAYVHSAFFSGLVALSVTTWSYARIMKTRRHAADLELDPMGLWIFKDIYSIGPRLLLEGLHQVRCCAQLDELNVAACARALTYLAGKNAAVTRDELMAHCAQMPWERLREQLLLLDGVLFLGEEGLRVTLMEPLRLRLRAMLGQKGQTAPKPEEPARPRRAQPVCRDSRAESLHARP